MTKSNGLQLLCAALVTVTLTGPRVEAAPPASMDDSPLALSAVETQAIKNFESRLADYLALHRKLQATLPALPKKATPAQYDQNQRALSTLIRAARQDAQQGAFFAPDMQALVRRALGAALGGGAGKTSMDSITDDNPVLPGISVNDRYPETLPLSTMPLQVLTTLPKLEDGLEYRISGERLILLDTHANLIIDFTGSVLP